MRNNLFIVIEGQDGAGKSTIAKKLSEFLNAHYYKTPSGYYNQIRTLVDNNRDVKEHFLFYLAAVRFASQDIKSILSSKTVICDRYIYSTVAYHKALTVGIDIDIDQLDLIFPDYVFYLQISSVVQSGRIMAKAESKTESDDWIMAQNVFSGIEAEFSRFPIIKIDTTIRNEEMVVAEIVKTITKGG